MSLAVTTKARPEGRVWSARWLVVALAGLWLAVFVWYIQFALVPGGHEVGMDFLFYRGLGERWLADGTWYTPRQLAGPHEPLLMVDNLYPPSALPLIVALAVLPLPVATVLWWAIPLGVLAYAAWRWRPGPWAWVAVLLLLMWPGSMSVLAYGNTNLWIAAGVAGGLLWGWPAALLVLKPTLAPLALVGVRHRSFWLAAGVLAVFGLLTLPLWLEYAQITLTVRGLPPSYILWGLPIVLAPLVMWRQRMMSA